MVLVTPPWQMTFDGQPVRGVEIHQKLAVSLTAVFEDIAAQVGRDWTRLPPGAVKFSGSYNFRNIRGSTRMSCHAFGAAIDMDAEANPMNTNGGRGTMSHIVIDAFKRQGWYWGGDFHSRQDPMHFQAANEGSAQVEAPRVPEAPKAPEAPKHEPQGSPPVRSTPPLVIPVPPKRPLDAPKPPSMTTSKTGWAAIILGGSGGIDALRLLNEYLSEIATTKVDLSALDLPSVGHWLWAHPGILVPVVIIAAAAFVWEDHRKYKRLLAEAQKAT